MKENQVIVTLQSTITDESSVELLTIEPSAILETDTTPAASDASVTIEPSPITATITDASVTLPANPILVPFRIQHIAAPLLTFDTTPAASDAGAFWKYSTDYLVVDLNGATLRVDQ